MTYIFNIFSVRSTHLKPSSQNKMMLGSISWGRPFAQSFQSNVSKFGE